MARWTKDAAIDELRRLIAEIDTLTQVRRFSRQHSRWLAQTLRFLEDIFGTPSLYYQLIVNFRWSRTEEPIGMGPLITEIERQNQQTYVHQLDTARGLLEAALKELEKSSTIEDVYKDEGTSDFVKILTLVERKLRKVVRKQPQLESTVQDAIEDLLVGAGIEYSRGTDSIEYSSKTYKPDFSLRKLDLAIEVKLSNRDSREKEIIAEINDDILAYKTKYGNILFVVYDLGFIRDVEQFAAQFEQHQGVMVRVIKH
jgi:hypothetical protein